jgi:anti-anti-sigma factor
VGQSDATFVFRIDESPDVVVAVLEGELDIERADSLVDALAPAAGRELTIDMKAVTFMDSSGIAALLRLRQAAASFRVVQPSQAVTRVLELTDLYEELCGPG